MHYIYIYATTFSYVQQHFFWWVLQHCTGFARLVWGRLRVHPAFVYSDWFVCYVCFCSLLPSLTLLLSFLWTSWSRGIWQAYICVLQCVAVSVLQCVSSLLVGPVECDRRTYAWLDSCTWVIYLFVYVTWLIRMCDGTHSCVWRDACIHGTWLLAVPMECDMKYS